MRLRTRQSTRGSASTPQIFYAIARPGPAPTPGPRACPLRFKTPVDALWRVPARQRAAQRSSLQSPSGFSEEGCPWAPDPRLRESGRRRPAPLCGGGGGGSARGAGAMGARARRGADHRPPARAQPGNPRHGPPRLRPAARPGTGWPGFPLAGAGWTGARRGLGARRIITWPV